MITVPDRETLIAELLAALKTARPQIDTSKGSPEWARVNALVELTYGIYWNLREVQYDIWPGPNTPTASLEKHAELRLGPDPRIPASAASGTDILRVTGTLAGAAVAAGDALVHSDGTRFQITENVTVGSGTADVSIEAITKGAIGNKLSGDLLDFESAPANIETEATLQDDLGGGRDQETDAELLERVEHAFVNPPAGGRFSDYWKWARAVEGVGESYCYGPHSSALTGRRGVGIVDVAVLAPGTGSARRPSANLVADVQDAIDAQRPVHAKPGLALRPAADSQDVDVQLTPRPGYEWDWEGTLTVHTWTLGSLLLRVTTSIPQEIQDLIDRGSTARIFNAGLMMTVDAYDNADPYTMTVTEAPLDDYGAAVTPTGTVYPGGPLSAGSLQAIKDYVNTLGPARPAYADPDQNWDSVLRVSQIQAALLERRRESDGAVVGVAGVLEVNVVTPAANVTPADDPSTVPDFIHYGTITVRPT